MRIDKLEPVLRVQWTPVGVFPGWIGTSIAWQLDPAEDGRTVVNFEHGGWLDQRPMIIDRLGNQVARKERAPHCTADVPLPSLRP